MLIWNHSQVKLIVLLFLVWQVSWCRKPRDHAKQILEVICLMHTICYHIYKKKSVNKIWHKKLPQIIIRIYIPATYIYIYIYTYTYIHIYIYICFSSHDKGVFFSVFDCWVLCVFRGKNMWRRGFLNLQFIVQTG